LATSRALTSFEQVLLGLIAGRPQSGYELRKALTDTPAGVYRPSPGALVPALHRLEQRGLLQVETVTSMGRRTRRVYHLTRTGRAEHLAWVRQPVDGTTVAKDLGLHLMRFVMMEHLLPPTETLAFLQALADALEAFITAVERYRLSAPLPGRHPRLALQHGIEVHRASLRWTQETVAILTDATAQRATPATDSGTGLEDRSPRRSPPI
jgi:PadR family transcriptional regulator, regulatory protein AphA